MIKTKEDLRFYLAEDKRRLGITHNRPRLFHDRIWKYQIRYRRTEYLYNNRHRNIFYKIVGIFAERYWKWSNLRKGIELPINCIGPGLVIWHGHNIIINPNAKIGQNFSISANCVIGQAKNQYPIIGDNVEMTIGSMVLGGITIADNVAIAPGAVVVKSCEKSHVTLGGVPAKIIHDYNID